MSDEYKEVGVLIVVVFLLGAVFIAVVALGAEKARHHIRVEAVEHGHGEWVTDNNGAVEFRWKHAQESEASDG